MTAEQAKKVKWLSRAICAQEDLDKMKQKHEQEKSHAERTIVEQLDIQAQI